MKKKNIKIIKPNDWNAKRIEIRFIKNVYILNIFENMT